MKKKLTITISELLFVKHKIDSPNHPVAQFEYDRFPTLVSSLTPSYIGEETAWKVLVGKSEGRRRLGRRPRRLRE